MEVLTTFIDLEVRFFLVGLLLVVAYQILTGRINMRGVFSDSISSGFSPGRVQLLVLALVGALYYFLKVARDPAKFPDVPAGLLLIMGGSSSIYLGGKIRSLLLLLRQMAESDN